MQTALLASVAVLSPTVALYHRLIARDLGTGDPIPSLSGLIRIE
jgi:hypothetical protein